MLTVAVKRDTIVHGLADYNKSTMLGNRNWEMGMTCAIRDGGVRD